MIYLLLVFLGNYTATISATVSVILNSNVINSFTICYGLANESPHHGLLPYTDVLVLTCQLDCSLLSGLRSGLLL